MSVIRFIKFVVFIILIKMPIKLDRCVKRVKAQIKKSKIGKTYKCDAQGRPNPRGRHRCKTSAWAICRARLKL